MLRVRFGLTVGDAQQRVPTIEFLHTCAPIGVEKDYQGRRLGVEKKKSPLRRFATIVAQRYLSREGYCGETKKPPDTKKAPRLRIGPCDVLVPLGRAD